MIISDLSYFEGIDQKSCILGSFKKISPTYLPDMTHIAIGEADARAIVSSPYLSTFAFIGVSTRSGRLPDGSVGSLSISRSISTITG